MGQGIANPARQATWMLEAERIIHVYHIQPGKPAQNAYTERFNRTFRREVLDAHLFASLSEVREIAHEWMTAYNDDRPHQALGNVPPSTFSQPKARSETEPTTARNSVSELRTGPGSLQDPNLCYFFLAFSILELSILVSSASWTMAIHLSAMSKSPCPIAPSASAAAL